MAKADILVMFLILGGKHSILTTLSMILDGVLGFFFCRCPLSHWGSVLLLLVSWLSYENVLLVFVKCFLCVSRDDLMTFVFFFFTLNQPSAPWIILCFIRSTFWAPIAYQACGSTCMTKILGPFTVIERHKTHRFKVENTGIW